MEGQTQGCVDLVLAVFRLAVCDHAGLAYGHDGPGRPRVIRSPRRAEAEAFLRGPWAAVLADRIGLTSARIWREARAPRSLRRPAPGIGPAPAPLRVAGSGASSPEASRRVA